jgi:hypothetical protein
MKNGTKIGDPYLGGRLIYIYQPGDPGYDPAAEHGLIASVDNLSDACPWAKSGFQRFSDTKAYNTELGTGKANTAIIVSQNGSGTDYAAGLCDAYVNPDNGTGVFDDWYLPSQYEMYLVKMNGIFGRIPNFYAVGTERGEYWTSSEDKLIPNPWHCENGSYAFTIWLGDYSFGVHAEKRSTKVVRAIRSF